MMYSKLILASTILGAATIGSANLVTNSSFETNALVGTGFYTLAPGNTTLTGWTIGQTSIDVVGTSYSPQDGDYAVDLAGTPGPGSISQDLTTNAEMHTISFWAKGQNATNQDLRVSFNGVETAFTLTGSWAQYSYNAMGAAGTTAISFATPVTNTTNGNMFIDNVNVVAAVPEPATMAILGMGIAGFARRRKNK